MLDSKNMCREISRFNLVRRGLKSLGEHCSRESYFQHPYIKFSGRE
jgi:hypothetical protein